MHKVSKCLIRKNLLTNVNTNKDLNVTFVHALILEMGQYRDA